MEINLYAFRVHLGSGSIAQVDTTKQIFHTRKAHTKSRRGCDYCKQRRRKCDETRPTCSLCAKTKRECIYAHSNDSSSAPTQVTRRLSSHGATTPSPAPSPWPGPRSPAVLTKTLITTHTKYDLELVDHFFKSTGSGFNATGMPGLNSIATLNLAKEYPYVMHGMIALAACHLQHMGIDGSRYRNPEAFHCQIASRELRKALMSINNAKEADAVLSTAMILNCFSFCAPEYREPDPTDISNRPWTWLRIQIGIFDIVIRTRQFWSESIWGTNLLRQPEWRIDEPPTNNLDKQLAIFCDIHEHSTPDNSPYFEFWNRLSVIVVREPSEAYLLLYVAAMGAMNLRLVELFEKQDTKALMLFVHWARLMIKAKTWWSARRMKSTCWAACKVLQRKVTERDLELLAIPAEACGFALSPKIEEVEDS